jgi:hypothetical protein
MARLFILSRSGTDPVLGQIWQPHWAIIPDLGIDLLGTPLVRALGWAIAGKILLGLALLAPLLGAVAYSRAKFGHRLYWPMSAALMTYNLCFVLGFINYLLSLGAALAAAGLWQLLRERPPLARVLVGAALACGLFFIHFIGVAYLALLVGAAELSHIRKLYRSGTLTHLRVAMEVVVLCGSFVGPVLLWRLTPEGAHAPIHYLPPLAKTMFLPNPFLAYYFMPGLIVAACFMTAVIWTSRHAPCLVPEFWLVQSILLLAYFGLPFALGGATFVDTRIPLMVTLLLSAGINPTQGDAATPRWMPAILIVAFGIVLGSVLAVWAPRNQEAADLRATIASVPAGSRVLVAMPRFGAANPYWTDVSRRVLALGLLRIDYQLPAFIAIDRRAFWPLLFADPAQHPIRVRPPYDTLAVAQGVPPDLPDLMAQRSLDPDWPAPYLAGWQDHYQYLLVIDASAVRQVPEPLARWLQPVGTTSFASLFHIRSATDPRP